jgi:DNA-binding SARP family transcriptional activator/TolB-like protein/tetratricopeptide (TPR) repeat protein
LRLKTFGGLALLADSKMRGGAAAQRRPLAVLALLATAREGMSRDKIAGILWPESDRERSRNALRQTLHILRRDLEAPDVIVGTSDLRLNDLLLGSDVREFDDAIARKDLGCAIAQYSGPFGDGFYVDGAPEFERWLDEERARRRRQFAEIVEASARASAQLGELEQTVSLWRLLAAQEPLNSRVAVRLMHAVADAGDIPGALQHARVHELLVRQELEVGVDPAVSALTKELRGRLTAASPAGSLVPSATKPSESSLDYQDAAETTGPAKPMVSRIAISGVTSTVPHPRWRPRRMASVAALVVTTAIAAIWQLSPAHSARRTLSGRTFLVLPFEHSSMLTPAFLSGNQCAALIQDALSRWRDVKVVDELRVTDALIRGGPSLSIGKAVETARRLGARYAVTGNVTEVGDTVIVRARLSDAYDGRLVRTSVVHLARRPENLSARFAELTDSLLMRASGDLEREQGSSLTSSLEAWQAYDDARVALQNWGVDSAITALRNSTRLDPEFAAAWLLFAKVENWSGRTQSVDAREASLHAAALGSKLSPRQRTLAAGLQSLSNGRFAEACGRFETMLRADSTNIDALFGLADCNERDSLVLDDPTTRSGLRFRGSMNLAEQSLRRALDLAPTMLAAFRGRAYARIGRILYVDAWRARPGYVVRGKDTIPVAAFPEVKGDSVVFVPFTIDMLRRSDSKAQVPARLAAIRRNRDVWQAITRRWVRATPQSVEALEAHALALEAAGVLDARRNQESALDAVRKARRYAAAQPIGSDSIERRVRLASTEIRINLKLGRPAEVRRIADSVLDADSIDAVTASRLAGIAALTGRIERAARLMAAVAPIYVVVDASRRPVTVPRSVVERALRLHAYAAFATPRDSLRVAERELDRMIRAMLPPTEQARVREALMLIPLRLAFSEVFPAQNLADRLAGDPLIAAHSASVRGDAAAVRRLLSQAASRRTSVSASDVTLDNALQEALLSVESRDTAFAIQILDNSLNGMVGQSQLLSENPFFAAAVVRSMFLRATLAHLAGDTATVRRWGSMAVELWSNSDPALQPTVRGMRATLNRQ